MHARRHLALKHFAVILVTALAFATVPSIGSAQDVIVNSTDTPAVRLQQGGGANGAYEWHVAANETEFRVRDVTGGKFPFAVSAGAPSDSLFIDDNGRVGLGTQTPQGNLHIFGAANQDVFSGIGLDPEPAAGTGFNFGYSGSSFGIGSGFFNVRNTPGSVAPNPSLRFATANTQRMIIDNQGNVGIGDFGAVPGNPGQAPLSRLHVKGSVRVEGGSFIDDGTTLNVPDYVFEPDYKLLPLKQLARYIEQKKHLPEIPSAKEIKANGVDLSSFQMQLLKKVEELTLYTIEQEQTANSQQRKIRTQDKTIAQLRATVARLTDTLNKVATRLTVLEQSQRR